MYSLVVNILLVGFLSRTRAWQCQINRVTQRRRSSVRHRQPLVLHALRERYEYEEEDPYQTSYAGESTAARDLRNMRYEDDEDVKDIVVDKDYYDDYGDEEEYVEVRESRGEPDNTGNFWSNPKPGFDTLAEDLPYPRREEVFEERRERRRRPKKQTTFRSGDPHAPQKVENFYDRFFWYGFDPDDNYTPGDKTVFGGTKGKFNGLNYIDEDRPRKPTPETFRADEWYDDIMESLDESPADDGFEEDVVISKSVRPESRRPRPRRPLPPPDDEEYYYEDEERYERRPRRDRYERRDRRALRGGKESEDWVSDTVLSWFGPGEAANEREEVYDRRSRRRRKENEPWGLTNVLDGIFGVDREETDINAAMYSKQMGLDKPARSRGRSDQRRRRSGYAYPYVEDDDEVRRPAAAEYERENTIDDFDVVDVDAVIEQVDEPKEPERKRERTIEERAAAFERVPPAGVPAWGPSGEVGVDARTKATLDALEEIREASRKVELKEEEVIEAKEDIVVLKADFELQKKRLLASSDDRRRIRSRLRQMQMGIQDAARALRRAKAELEVARDRVHELEDRHWALLSMYDADKAFQEVVETFREFEESERLSTRLEDSEELNVDSDPAEDEQEAVAPTDETNVLDGPTASSTDDNEQPTH